MKSPLVLSRREALRHVAAGTLLASGLWPGALAAAGHARAENFHFLVINDTHYLSPDCGVYLEGVARQMKAAEADLVLHCGDLTELGKLEHLGAVRDVLRGLDRPCYTVVGNHDYLTQTDRQPYLDLFPKRVNYWFGHRGWQFIALDTTDGQKYEGTAIPGDTFAFVDHVLPRLDKVRPTVIFTHFPLGPGVNYRPEGSDDLLDRFREFNLQAVFCGHWHGHTERHVDAFFLTTGRCCALKRNNHDGTRQKGYLVCEAADDRVHRRFVEYAPARVT